MQAALQKKIERRKRKGETSSQDAQASENVDNVEGSKGQVHEQTPTPSDTHSSPHKEVAAEDITPSKSVGGEEAEDQTQKAVVQDQPVEDEQCGDEQTWDVPNEVADEKEDNPVGVHDHNAESETDDKQDRKQETQHSLQSVMNAAEVNHDRTEEVEVGNEVGKGLHKQRDAKQHRAPANIPARQETKLDTELEVMRKESLDDCDVFISRNLLLAERRQKHRMHHLPVQASPPSKNTESEDKNMLIEFLKKSGELQQGGLDFDLSPPENRAPTSNTCSHGTRAHLSVPNLIGSFFQEC
eukprot:754421-Hanusia_phi.AAC.3